MNELTRFAIIAAVGLVLPIIVLLPLATSGPFRVSMYFQLDILIPAVLIWVYLLAIYNYNSS